jgi:hypothetical protein
MKRIALSRAIATALVEAQRVPAQAGDAKRLANADAQLDAPAPHV